MYNINIVTLQSSNAAETLLRELYVFVSGPNSRSFPIKQEPATLYTGFPSCNKAFHGLFSLLFCRFKSQRLDSVWTQPVVACGDFLCGGGDASKLKYRPILPRWQSNPEVGTSDKKLLWSLAVITATKKPTKDLEKGKGAGSQPSADKSFYKNLPFHGLKSPPKQPNRNYCTDSVPCSKLRGHNRRRNSLIETLCVVFLCR